MGKFPGLVALGISACTLPSVASAQTADANVLAYGEHLSGECTTCHRIDGTDNGIPPIIGWPIDTFFAVMTSYKQGERTNQAMISVAQSLDEDQINALGAYFSRLKPKP
ncbi:MAG TPA: hypothetical protein P5114_06880 [Hyphomicrobiaceae bacterium]|nr:hypothetical protein [Hyphomicrobiaceae bacterium]